MRVAYVLSVAALLSISANALAANKDVDIEPTGPAEANVLAVSGTGAATTRSGTSISLLGDAHNTECFFGLAPATLLYCVAVAPMGDATNQGNGSPCGGDRDDVFSCVAVSATGDATNEGRSLGCRGIVSCVAVSGTGNASNAFGDSGCAGLSVLACFAASGTGNASNSHGSFSCLASGVSCVAISLAGNASNTGDRLCDSRFPAVGIGCLAVAPEGATKNDCVPKTGVVGCQEVNPETFDGLLP